MQLALGELAQPGIDVAAKLEHLEVVAKRQQLRAAAQARGADASALGQIGDRGELADEGIGRVLANRAPRPGRGRRSARRAGPWPSAPRARPRLSSSIRSTPRTQRALSPGSPSPLGATTSSESPIASATVPAWIRASALPRVATLIGRVSRAAAAAPVLVELGHLGVGRVDVDRLGAGVEPEQLAQRVDVDVRVLLARRPLDPQRRLVQQPAGDRARPSCAAAPRSASVRPSQRSAFSASVRSTISSARRRRPAIVGVTSCEASQVSKRSLLGREDRLGLARLDLAARGVALDQRTAGRPCRGR